MERRIYATLIYGRVSRYVLGWISGMFTAICKEDPMSNAGYGIYENSEYFDADTDERFCYGLVEKTTEEKYSKFRAIVEALYPGVCKFDASVKL